MPDWATTAIIDVGVLLLAGILAAVFKLPEKWLGHSFDAKLEVEKSRLSGQIEQLKARLDHFSDRGKRANELEYDAIIKAWEQFVDAYIASASVVSSFVPNPGFEGGTDAQIKDFLAGCGFSNSEQDYVLASKDRLDAYFNATRRRSVSRAHNAVYDAHSVLRKQGIFIPKDVEVSILAGLDMVGKAVSEQSLRTFHGVSGGLASTLAMSTEGNAKFDSIKDLVRERLLIAAAPK